MLNANHSFAALRASLQHSMNIIQQPEHLGHVGVGILQIPLLVTTFPICSLQLETLEAFGMKQPGCIFGSWPSDVVGLTMCDFHITEIDSYII